MLVFLPNLPPSTRKSELSTFIAKALKPDVINPFRKTGCITKLELMVLRDSAINWTEYHALIDISPDTAALRAIRRLRQKKFKGKKIIARRYYPRDWHNDRRMPVPENAEINHLHRRIHDRRRYHIEIVEDEIIALDDSF
ncbi:MAG: hypothetical protein ACU826_11450 [Gammaproteobacteria bacterium]